MTLTSGWQQYANLSSITPIDKAFPLAAPVAGTSSSTTPKPTGMDPLSAVMGIANIGTSIASLFGQQSAADKQAKEIEEVINKQIKAAEAGAKLGYQAQASQIGFNYLSDRDKFGAGGAGDTQRKLRDLAAFTNFEANNPSAAALRSVQRYEDQLARAFNRPGYTPASAMFG